MVGKSKPAESQRQQCDATNDLTTPPPTTATNAATAPTYAMPKPSLVSSGHMEKQASGGNHAAKLGARNANMVTGSKGNKMDFSWT